MAGVATGICGLFPGRKLLLGGLILALALLDPFGLTSATDDASSQLLNRVFSVDYPSQGQQRITVILIDDAYLLRHRSYWPLPYNEQSRLLKRLLAYRPQAVFVDLLYGHEHSRNAGAQDSTLLANVFDRYRHRGIPLLLANTGLLRGVDGQINTLPTLATVSQPALVSWSGVQDHYPLALETPSGWLETPALGLYRHYCRYAACGALPDTAEQAAALAPMAIQWGMSPPPRQAQVADISPCYRPRSFAWETATQLLNAIFWRFDNGRRQACAYNLTLSASDLEANSPEDRALLRELLEDRLVLVGARITSAGDLATSPVHGKIAGIHVHAMALDNLINLGLGYDRDPANVGNSQIDWLDLMEIGLLGLIVLLKALHQRQAESPRQQAETRWQRWATRLFLPLWPSWLLVIALLVALSYLLKEWHIVPVNILGILLVSLVLLSEPIERFFERKDALFAFISKRTTRKSP